MNRAEGERAAVDHVTGEEHHHCEVIGCRFAGTREELAGHMQRGKHAGDEI